jgi:hypothetical protein
LGWDALIDQEAHPIKVAAMEALRVIGGPLSARELWLIDIGAGAPYGTVAYHVRAMADLKVIVQTHKAPARGSEEKFYVLRSAEA